MLRVVTLLKSIVIGVAVTPIVVPVFSGPSDSSVLAATDLSVAVKSNGASFISVAPSATIYYEVVGELSDDANEGLAFFQFDLCFDGGDLQAADTPTHPPMSGFVIPSGFTNAAGFGGALDVPGREGDLVQVGGAQNVINNTVDIAPYPIGSVITGVAWPGVPQTMVTGQLTAPAVDGSYTLELTNAAARVITQGEAGDPFWATEATGLGAITNLTIVVSAGEDCNVNGIPDECDIDCGPTNGRCDVPGCGQSLDENGDAIPDECSPAIPTTSACGLMTMTPLLLAMGALVLTRRRRVLCGPESSTS